MEGRGLVEEGTQGGDVDCAPACGWEWAGKGAGSQANAGRSGTFLGFRSLISSTEIPKGLLTHRGRGGRSWDNEEILHLFPPLSGVAM